MFQPPRDFSAFATNEQVDAIMLDLENFEETIPEGRLGAFALPWDRDGFVGPGGGVVFDEIFKIVVVDVVCGACGQWLVASLCDGRGMTSVGTHSDPIAEPISASTVGRTSWIQRQDGMKLGHWSRVRAALLEEDSVQREDAGGIR